MGRVNALPTLNAPHEWHCWARVVARPSASPGFFLRTPVLLECILRAAPCTEEVLGGLSTALSPSVSATFVWGRIHGAASGVVAKKRKRRDEKSPLDVYCFSYQILRFFESHLTVHFFFLSVLIFSSLFSYCFVSFVVPIFYKKPSLMSIFAKGSERPASQIPHISRNRFSFHPLSFHCLVSLVVRSLLKT